MSEKANTIERESQASQESAFTRIAHHPASRFSDAWGLKPGTQRLKMPLDDPVLAEVPQHEVLRGDVFQGLLGNEADEFGLEDLHAAA